MRRIARESFLIDIQPDELVYSVVARLCEARQIQPTQFNEKYLGSRVTSVSHDVPPRIAQLAALVPNADARSLIENHTLLPFLAATMHQQRRRQVVDDIAEGKAYFFFMSFSRTTPRATLLRYCLTCDFENRERYGFAYWDRRHQLPTSLVCGRHRTPLLISPISTGTRRKAGYMTAGNWGGERPTLVPDWQGPRLDRCVRLAQLGYKMLNATYDEPRTVGALREIAVRAGYGIATRNTIAMSRLTEDLEKRDAFLHRLWPNLGPTMRMPFSWVAPHLTSSRELHHKPAFTWAVLKTFFETNQQRDHSDVDVEVPWDGVMLEEANLHLDARLSEDDLVARTTEAAAAIRERRPEQRVTRSEIYRQAPIIGKRRSLPGVANAIETSSETAEQFERRRIQRGIQQLLREGGNLTVNGVRVITKAYKKDLIRQEIDAVLQNGHEHPQG
ncbi:TniQ family protein [Sphingomonas arantia]|uniref:TniQ family protein n=1 Tax=Sphingomonas arantia TaxID=1460676 RepID=A0ABW4U1S7_9SPHN